VRKKPIVVTIVIVALILWGATKAVNYLSNAGSGELTFWGLAMTTAILFYGRRLIKFSLTAINQCFIRIPTSQMGIVTQFGRRTGEVVDEGLHLLIVFVESVILTPNTTYDLDVLNKFPTADGEPILCEQKVQWRFDPNIKTAGKSTCVYYLDNPAAVNAGITAALQEKLASLGNLLDSDVFRKNQHPLSDFLELYLRVEEKRHPHKGQSFVSSGASKTGGSGSAEETVDAAGFIKFFIDRHDDVKILLDGEDDNPTPSTLEKRYGVRITAYSLAKIDYTPESLAAREAGLKAERLGEGFGKMVSQAREAVVGDKSIPGIDPNVVMHAAEAYHQLQGVRTLALEGQHTATPVVVMNDVFGGQAPPQPKEKGGGKSRKGGRR